jgi:hypothetical protein
MEFVPKLILLAVLCLQGVSASQTGSSVSDTGSESSTRGLISGIKVLYRTYEQCEREEDMFACLKLKALKFADRALQVQSIPLVEGVEIVKKGDAEDSRHLNEPLVELGETNLPADPEKRQETLDDFLIDRLSRFLRSHTLQFSVPKFISDLDDRAGEKILQEGESHNSITSPRMAMASSGCFSFVKFS